MRAAVEAELADLILREAEPEGTLAYQPYPGGHINLPPARPTTCLPVPRKT